jgi:hypothetical protein
VSPQESGQICLLACVLGTSGDIFFPKLDEAKDMINFADVVAPFLRRLGFEAEVCDSEQIAREKAIHIESNRYPVYFFASETSGEKLYEEFYTDKEELVMDAFHALGVIKNAPRRSRQELNNTIAELKGLFGSGTSKADVVILLNKLLPGFQHIETGMNLDQKM